jgi:HJR/Mrr/RecB family endonuclease
VEHISASRRGDRGVDVYARRADAHGEECWVIQCKCWSPRRKVGPSVIRELIGALAAYPPGTRGMVVTTSSFTSGAKELAETNSVRLMDGAGFLKAKSSVADAQS